MMTIPAPSLSQPTLASHLRLIFAVAYKDWQHFWRYPMNVISFIIQPIIWIVPVFYMGKAFSVNGQALGFAAYSGTSDYMSFVLLGSFLSNYIMAVFWGMGYAMKNDMDGGTLEANWLAPLPRPLLLVGHTLTNLATTTITSLVMLAAAGWIFGLHINGSVLGAILGVLPMLIGLYGFGFAFAALVLIMREANTMVDVSSFVIQALSGSNFPVQVLPRFILPISLAIPLTYGYDVMRGKLLGTRTLLPMETEILLLIAFMFAMIAFGLWAFKALERRARIKGTLGAH